MKTLQCVFLLLCLFNCSHLMAQGQNLTTPEVDQIYVTAVSWSHDGSKIAAVGVRMPSTQGYLRVFDVQTGRILYALDLVPGGFTAVDWSPDDRFLAVAGFDQAVWVIDLISKKHVASLFGHASTILAVDWSPDGRRLISGGNWDGLVILWDMIEYDALEKLSVGDVWSVAFSPDGQRIAVGGSDLRILPAHLKMTNQNLYRYFPSLTIGALAWNFDGTRLVFGTQTFNNNQAKVYIVDGNTGSQLTVFSTDDEAIQGIDWSTDGGLVSTYDMKGSVKIWDIDSGKLIETYVTFARYPVDVSFSPYGGRLAFGAQIAPDHLSRDSSLASQGVQIFVPAPSLDRLNAIAALCDAPLQPIDSLNALPDFVAQVEALPEGAIPDACRADLLAVADALLKKGGN